MIVQKAIACTLAGITIFLLIAAITNADWATSEGWREGLFEHCPSKGIATPLPFYQPVYMADAKAGCHPRVKIADTDEKLPEKDEEDKVIEGMPGYCKGVLVLVVIALLVDFVGTVLTGLGLKSEDQEKNKKYNLIAIFSFAVAFLLLLIAAVVYHINFTADQEAQKVQYDGCIEEWGEKICGNDVEVNEDWPMNDTNSDGIPDAWHARAGEKREFGYGFCYGVVCLSVVFLLISVALLILDHFNPDPKVEKEGEERAA